MEAVKKKVQKLDQPFKLRRTKIKIDCIAFADDLLILTREIQNAQRQVDLLKETTEKVGLQISLDVIITTCNKLAPKYLHTKYGKIKRVPHFKYLGGTV